MKRHWIRTAVLLVFLAAAAGLFAALFFAVKSKKLQINRWVVSPRDVIGVDISEYQADVDMEALAEQNISFIYMKATEGSSYTDSRFRENWENAEEAGIPAGAYHFFSFDSYPRWIRSVYYPAAFEAGGNWTVWQYSDTGELEGYGGGERYIDLDVLKRGTDLKELMAED